MRNNGAVIHLSWSSISCFFIFTLSRNGNLFYFGTWNHSLHGFDVLMIWTLWLVSLRCECITMTFGTLRIGPHQMITSGSKNLHLISPLGGSNGFICIISLGLKKHPNTTLFYYVSCGTIYCLVWLPDGNKCLETHVDFSFLLAGAHAYRPVLLLTSWIVF